MQPELFYPVEKKLLLQTFDSKFYWFNTVLEMSYCFLKHVCKKKQRCPVWH